MTTSDDRSTTDTTSQLVDEQGPADPGDDAPDTGQATETGPAPDTGQAADTDQAPDTAQVPADAVGEPEPLAADEPLMPGSVALDYQARWAAIQQGFVDDPRSAVTDADNLVGDVLEKLRTTFDEQHHALEHQWSDGEPSTEDLRSALRRYRDFFDRLLRM